jgi:lysine 6-dehydrogenase
MREILVLGAGMMGRAIAFDLCNFSQFNVSIADKNEEAIRSARQFLKKDVDFILVKKLKEIFRNFDVVISAIPFIHNYTLTVLAIESKTHLLDLGGNIDIVKKQKSLSKKAAKKDVTIIPDCGLAPGITSVITREIVEEMDYINYVKIRVGGLPLNPKPPLDYQIVFSPYGLINEYTEKSVVLENHEIKEKPSLTEVEEISFPSFGKMEAFLTSGGSSTLPYTYKDKIGYLDYKTIRYKGHCERFKTLIELGLCSEEKIRIKSSTIAPRDVLARLLLMNLPKGEEDVVLLRVVGEGKKDNQRYKLEYTMIDYYDFKNGITAMMRTSAYPISIAAQMLNNIDKRGVFCPEEIIPCKPFFQELKKRNINIRKRIKKNGGI